MSNFLKNLGFKLWIQVARLFNPKRRRAMNVGMQGKPNAGKGTISERLSVRLSERLQPPLKVPVLSTGNLLRSAIAEKSKIGLQVEELVKAGKFVGDDVVIALVRNELSKPEYDNGAIFDGFPRTLTQAKKLRKMLAWRGNALDIVILLDVSEPDLIERMSFRRTCTKCGRTYHLKMNPPKAEGVCDLDGAAIVQRDDDQPDKIVTRLKEFDREFAPLFDYYSGLGLLVRVESRNDRGIDQTFEDVKFAVDEVD